MTEKGLKLRCSIADTKSLMAESDGIFEHYSGELLIQGDVIGVVVEDARVNSDFVLIYEASAIMLPKVVGTQFAAGDDLYYDAMEHRVTSEHRDNLKCGQALQAAGLEDTEVLARLGRR
jgi:predicted RecA/RadA family phage recombinase